MPSTVKIMPKVARKHSVGPLTNPRVIVIAYDGLCTFEFGCAVEVFGLARPEMGPGWYRCAIAAAEPGLLRAACGITLGVDGGLNLLAGAGTVIVPGWRAADALVPQALCEALQKAHAAGARILSLCSGAFVLAAAGLLEGKRATTHWRYFDRLATGYPNLTLVPDVLYVDEGSILTAAGSAAGLDLCLHLVRRDWGPRTCRAPASCWRSLGNLWTTWRLSVASARRRLYGIISGNSLAPAPPPIATGSSCLHDACSPSL